MILTHLSPAKHLGSPVAVGWATNERITDDLTRTSGPAKTSASSLGRARSGLYLNTGQGAVLHVLQAVATVEDPALLLRTRLVT